MPDFPMPGRTDFTADQEKAMRATGRNKLKSELAGVYDAAGTEHPTSPHYSESQDATEEASRSVSRAPKVMPDYGY